MFDGFSFFLGNKEKRAVHERVSQRLPWRVFAKALAGGGCSDAVASFLAVD